MNLINPNWWRCDSTCNSLAPRNWQLQSKLVSLIFLSRHKFPIILLLSTAYLLFVKHFVTLVGSLQQLLVLIHIDYFVYVQCTYSLKIRCIFVALAYPVPSLYPQIDPGHMCADK